MSRNQTAENYIKVMKDLMKEKIIKDIPFVKSGSVYKLIKSLLILTKQP